MIINHNLYEYAYMYFFFIFLLYKKYLSWRKKNSYYSGIKQNTEFWSNRCFPKSKHCIYISYNQKYLSFGGNLCLPFWTKKLKPKKKSWFFLMSVIDTKVLQVALKILDLNKTKFDWLPILCNLLYFLYISIFTFLYIFNFFTFNFV